jgi:hypothetical protein
MIGRKQNACLHWYAHIVSLFSFDVCQLCEFYVVKARRHAIMLLCRNKHLTTIHGMTFTARRHVFMLLCRVGLATVY